MIERESAGEEGGDKLEGDDGKRAWRWFEGREGGREGGVRTIPCSSP